MSGFSFGSTTPSSGLSNPFGSSSSSIFGKSDQTSLSNDSKTSNLFSTGSSTIGSTSGLFGNQNTNSQPASLFGTNPLGSSVSSSNTPLFGSNSTSSSGTLFSAASSNLNKDKENTDKLPSSGFSFGESKATETPASNKSMFSFGTNASAEKKPNVSFASNDSNSAATPSSSGFSFGGANAESSKASKPSDSLFGAENKPFSSSGLSTGSIFTTGTSSNNDLFGSSSPRKKSSGFNTSDDKSGGSIFGGIPSDSNLNNGGLFGSSGTVTTPSDSKKNVTFDISKNTVKEFKAPEKDNSQTDNSQLSKTNVNAEEALANLELNGLSMEKIISLWHEKLQSHVELYAATAEQVRQRDILLLKNQKTITELAKEAQLLKSEQNELQWNLDTVTELQYDLNSSLDQLEQQLDVLESKQPQVFDKNADSKRQDAYNNISLINSKLNTMQLELKNISEKLSFESTKPSQEEQKESDSPIASILQVMSKHQMSLDWLRESTSRLSNEIEDVSRSFGR